MGNGIKTVRSFWENMAIKIKIHDAFQFQGIFIKYFLI